MKKGLRVITLQGAIGKKCDNKKTKMNDWIAPSLFRILVAIIFSPTIMKLFHATFTTQLCNKI